MEKKLLKAMFFLLTVNIIYGTPASQYVDITSVTGITTTNTKSSGAGAMAIGPASEAHGPNSIAIGNGAKTEFFPEGNHEKIVAFGRTKDKLSGGIAIGNKTHARVGTIDIGHRDITGAIGDWNAQGSKSDLLDRISTTTVGDNSINRGNFSSIFGAYNIISKRPRVNGKGILGFISNSTAATQGLGSVITGTLNSIEGNEQKLNYAGLASIVSGTANKISKSNGVAIIGVGNEVSNSYLTPNSEKLFNAFLTGGGSSNIKEFADTFREFSNEVELGSVGITGGANKVDFALFSNITGVGNKLIGSGARLNLTLNSNNTQAASDKFSTFNNILGYKNTLEDVNHLILIGSSNNVTTATSNLVFGNNHILKGTADAKAEGNIVLGFNTTKEESNFKVSGKNIVAVG
ncbi:left-handed beta-roll domain-containing protein, partial [Streptobacillus canis]|uniref:left-handed beta-roll domain-containing protein n=1 Tax=Streptobacillus canis TaxID=2678686 RepID=UPI0018CBFEBE